MAGEGPSGQIAGFQNLGHAFLVLGQLGALGFDELGGCFGNKAGVIQLAADEINVALALFALFFQAGQFLFPVDQLQHRDKRAGRVRHHLRHTLGVAG